jgi:hypothetical protein
MLSVKDILAEGSTYEISLYKLIGKRVVDVRGYLSDEFDEAVFKITVIELEDGTLLAVGGEHDFPYLEDLSKQPNGDLDTLQALLDEDDED